MTLSTIGLVLLVFLAHAIGFSLFVDRTVERRRALRPLAPLVAVTAIVASVASAFVLSGGLHRSVLGVVERKYEVPYKNTHAPMLAVRERNSRRVDVQVPSGLWIRCAVGATYERAFMSPTLRCGTDTETEDLLPVHIALGMWATLATALAAAIAIRLRRVAQSPL